MDSPSEPTPESTPTPEPTAATPPPYSVAPADGDAPTTSMPTASPAATVPGPAPVPDSEGRPAWVMALAVIGVIAVGVIAFLIARSAGGSGSSTATNNNGGGAGNGAATTGGGAGPGGANGPGGFVRQGAAGTIATIEGSTITISDPNGQSTKVTTTSATKVIISDTAAIGDIKVGDRVTAVGTASGTNTVTATSVSDQGTLALGPNGGIGGGGGGGLRNRRDANGDGTTAGSVPPGGPGTGGQGGQGPRGNFANGQVTAVNGDTITVKDRRGASITITTTSTTKFTKARQGSFSDLKVGQTIFATGKVGTDGTVAATVIREGELGGGRFGGGFGGGGPGFGGGQGGQGGFGPPDQGTGGSTSGPTPTTI